MKYHIILEDNVVHIQDVFVGLQYKMDHKIFERDLFNSSVKYDENGNYIKRYRGNFKCDGITIYALANKNKKDLIKLQIVKDKE